MPFLIPSNFLPLSTSYFSPVPTLLITQLRHASSKRAFQSVPRSMRRRTASHNVKRVPKRLRNRHAKEMADDNTPTVTSRRRKPTSQLRLRLETAKRLRALSQRNSKQERAVQEKTKLLRNQIPLEDALRPPPAPKSKFRKRQIHKTWLPTHVWHAKRAHMVVRWMYAIAESPTEKCFRSIHRASTLRGAVAWDHSYYGTIFIKGREKEIAAALKEVLGPEDAEIVAGKGLIRKGKRSWQGWVYEKNSYPTKPIAPVLLLWCKPPSTDPSEPKRKTDSKILIRIHPSAFFQLWMTILSIKKPYKSLIAEDLRFEIGSIEVCGPAATDALIASLQPREDPTGPEFPEDVWVNLRSLTNPSALPPGAFLAFNIMDPRIRFPPRLPSFPKTEELREERLFSTISTWPVDQKPCLPSLFSQEARSVSIRAKSSQRNINKRKEATAPGELPKTISVDPYIPIILIANRNSQSLAHSKKYSAATSKAIGSWTVLLPWKWVLPVWYSLLHFPSMRFGGVNEAKQIQYENSVGSFPDDFPGTRAGLEEEDRKATLRKQTWERRPKQKRTAWESVNLGEGRKGELGRGTWCDWDYLTGLVLRDNQTVTDIQSETDTLPEPVGISSTTSHSACTLQHESMNLNPPIPPAAQISPPIPISSTTTSNTSLPSQITTFPFHSSSSPWMVPSSLILPTLFQPHVTLQPPLSDLPPEVLAKAMLSVKIVFLNRGAPSERARIYRFPTKAHAQRNPLTHKLRDGWTNLLKSHEEYEASKLRYRKPELLHHQRQSQHRGQPDPGASRLHRDSLLPALRHHLPQPPIQPGHEGYPSVPGEEDLIGFVTSGNFNLKEGRGTGIAALSFPRVLNELISPAGRGGSKEALKRICVVRDVGEQVGRLARWEVIH